MYTDYAEEFLIDLERIKPLSKAEQDEMFKNLTPENKKRIVECNLKLVIAIAKQYTTDDSVFPDLVQEGTIGLIKAVENYNPGKHRLSTYAVPWIRKYIYAYVNDNAGQIRIPLRLKESARKVEIVSERIFSETGREPTAEEIGQYLDLTPYELKTILALPKTEVSIEEENQNGIPLREQIADDIEETYDADFEMMLSDLTQIEREAVLLKFGFKTEKCCTLVEISKRLGISKRRVKTAIETGLSKLNKPENRELLEEMMR